MKYRSLASFLTLALLLSAAVVHAQDAAPAAAAPAKPEKTALAKDMDKINRSVRALKKQISDATKNDASLALVTTIHDAATAALNETPAWTAEQPAADQAKFTADFQDHLKAFIGDVDKLSAALTAGDNAGAATLLATLGQDEKDGHKKFRKPEEKN
jgi:soluble cytochrome b562